jgi:hypothetical protein
VIPNVLIKDKQQLPPFGLKPSVGMTILKAVIKSPHPLGGEFIRGRRYAESRVMERKMEQASD